MKRHVAIASVIVALILSGPVIAGTIYVDDNAPNDPGPGAPWVSDPLEDGTSDHPYDAIQEGINAAADGVDDVLVKDGTYVSEGNRGLLFNGKSITVASENGAENCIIDCGGYNVGFYFSSSDDATSVVDGFTITNGSAEPSDAGGGIFCHRGSPTITNCTISGNIAGANGGGSLGGGIYCYGGSPTIANCTISGNIVDAHGGGIYCEVSSSPTITNCTISGNIAGADGGGIYCDESSSPTITNCTISGNIAGLNSGGGGGGIYCDDSSSPTISNCTISNNWASKRSGGGIYCEVRSSPTITNCRISYNSGASGGGISCWYNSKPTINNCTINGNSGASGGGISCWSSNPTISNCTISANSAAEGGGIYCYDSSPTTANCILWGNTAPTGHEIALNSTTDPSTLIVRFSDVQGGAGEAYVDPGCTLDLDGTNIDDDPLFVSGPLGDYYLSQIVAGQGADSPCVDTGSDTAANLGFDTFTTRTDEEPDAGTVDMGYHSPSPSIPGDVDGNGIVDGLDLTAVMTAWQTTSGDPLWDPAADLDGNGLIDGLDLTAVISNWTTTAAAAPEESQASVTSTSDPDTSRRGNVNKVRSNVHR
jgi:parallel beta-helix repeat protein